MAYSNIPLNKEIGDRLAFIRDGQPVKEFLIGNKLPLSLLNMWGRYEKALEGLSLPQLVKVCEIIDISPTWLIFGEGEMFLSSISQTKTHGLKNIGIDKNAISIVEALSLFEEFSGQTHGMSRQQVNVFTSEFIKYLKEIKHGQTRPDLNSKSVATAKADTSEESREGQKKDARSRGRS